MTTIDNKECSICLEEMITNVQILTCKHEFHKKCLQRWCSENNICPICRTTIYIPKTKLVLLKEIMQKCYFIILHIVFLVSMILNVLYANICDYNIVIFWVFTTILLYKHKEALTYMACFAFAFLMIYTPHRLTANEHFKKYEIRLLCSISVQSFCMILIDVL